MQGAAWSCLMGLLSLILLVLLHHSWALIIPGQDPVCGMLGPGECMARSTKCDVVKKLVQGKGGPVKDVFSCAKVMGIPKMQVIGVIGPAFSAGQPETIVDRVIPNDTAAAAQFRRCVFTTSGLLTMNGTLARTAMVDKLLAKGVFTHPAIIDTVAAAITRCPEPKDLKIADFLECVRATCIQQMPPGVSYLADQGGDDDDADDTDDDEDDDD